MTRTLVKRSTAHVPLADAARAIADNISALVDELNALRTTPQRRTAISERLRPFVRAHNGISEPGEKGFPQALALNIECWIKEARSKGHSGAWLRARCMAVDGKFQRVSMLDYEGAIAGLVGPSERVRRGPRPLLLAACHLVVAAQRYSNPGSLRKVASNYKLTRKRRRND